MGSTAMCHPSVKCCLLLLTRPALFFRKITNVSLQAFLLDYLHLAPDL